jgi:PAS domain S-box-containing protein
MLRWSVLERRLLPAYVWTTDPLTFWRERILLIICFLAAVLGPIALIPSLWLAYQERLWSVILLDSAAYITSVVIIIGRDWPLKGRTCGVCFILYALGACLLFILGPVGAGYIWLFGASVIISAIIGLEAAIWTLVLNAVTLLSISIFIRYGVMQWTILYDNALEKWLVMSANFLLLNAFVTLTTAMMLNGLSKALSTEQDFIHSLQESEERFRAISEFSHHAICIIDETARITWVNNRMLEISGYSREQVLGGRTFLDFLAPESSDFVMSNYLKFINGEVYQHHYHFNIIRADGANRLIEKYMTDYADKHGRKHLIISMIDVTDQKLAEDERKAMEEMLRQGQKMEAIGTLSGGIAHDFNNILSSVLGYAELALDTVEMETPLERYINGIYQAGIRARDLVRQILVFSRKSEKELKPVQVNQIVKEVLNLLSSTTPSNIKIEHNIDSKSLILSDAVQVHQVLMNLCTNAVYAMEDTGGTMTINLTDVMLDGIFVTPYPDLHPGNYIKLEVLDTGTGMTPDILEHIFDPFFTSKKPGEGTGMGLSVVHGIIKSSGGAILVDSTPGNGSSFTVYLPVLQNKSAVEIEPMTALSHGNEHILFIDDEARIADISEEILKLLGYRVTIRTSSLEALELFMHRSNDFDLVVTDMTMPNMTGDRLAIELMKIRPNIPVILCTGYSKKVSDKAASNIGIKALVYKPIVKADFAKTIRKVLDEAKGLTQ